MRMSSRVSRTLRTLSLSVLILGLAACAAPTPNGGTQASDEATPAKSATASADAASSSPRTASAQAEQVSDGKPMRTGGPLPADPIEHASGSRSGAAGAVDFSCQSDADCAVKNVGSCCGYHPGCVNKNSPTDPEGVKAQCAKQGMASVCGFQEISSCSCRQGRCEAGGGQLR